ncbi:MAG: oligosaccharide flippase family protein [Acidobacteriota bacterium]
MQDPSTLTRKFQLDTLWNVASLAVLAASGILLNVVIARAAGAEALGVFNQVFAIYIFLSQLSVGGIHLSVLKQVSHHVDDPQRCSRITVSALTACFALSTAVGLLTFGLGELVGRALGSPAVGTGMLWIAPGLVFFALNKVLLNALNGAAAMRAYAVFQALRFVLIVGVVVAILVQGWPAATLAASLTAAEVVLTPLLLITIQRRLWPLRLSAHRQSWLREHLSFGARGFLSGALGEINTRVDILVLGVFTSDVRVGIYSFAAILAEGFSQLPIVLRRNVDPLLGAAFASGDLERIGRHARELRRVFVPAMAAIGAVAVLGYPLALELLVGAGDFAASSRVFTILMIGVVINSAYRPFLGILLQSGNPGRHTLLVAALVAANLIGNVLLIPWLGLDGAACATALVFVLEALLIKWVAARVCGVPL